MKIQAILIIGVSLLCANAYAVTTEDTLSSKSKETSMSLKDKNKAEGEAFLAANKEKPGVVVLPDGLQYKVITAGQGDKPTVKDTVTVDYSGKLINGKEFDSSYKRGEPATFQLAGVIPGWTEALQLMKVGSTWELYIPAELAYGEFGAPPSIGPNETLIFKVTLVSIK